MVGMESWASGHHKYGGFGTGGPHEPSLGGNVDATTSLTSMTAAMGGPALNGSRGSLGKLIERSTSAPPSSSTALSEGYGYGKHGSSSGSKPFGGLSVVGGNLLEQLTRNYPEHSLRDLPSHNDFDDDCYSGGGGGGGGYPLKDTPSNQDLLSLLGGGASINSGRSTAPLSDASSMSHIPTSAHQSSSSSSIDAYSAGVEGLIRSHSAAPYSMVPDGGLIRSQSAAPTFQGSRFTGVAPPPGLGMGSVSASPGYLGGETTIHRPAASGSGMMTSAHRPAAKTALDLIQEDFPASNHGSFDHHDETPPSSSSSSQRTSPQSSSPKRYGGDSSGYRSEHQHVDSYTSTTTTMPNGGIVGERYSPQQQQQQHFIRRPQAQQQYSSPPRSSSAPLAEPALRRRESPPGTFSVTNQGSVNGMSVVQQQQPMQQMQQRTMESHQPVFYSHDGQPLQQQTMVSHPQGIQTAQVIHQNGQTIYLNAPVQSHPAQSYATIQYHPSSLQQQQRSSPTQLYPNQVPTQIIHQSGVGMNHEQHRYISVVPIQSNGILQSQGAATYWQPDMIAAPDSQLSHLVSHHPSANLSAMGLVQQQQHPQTQPISIINSGGGNGGISSHHQHHHSASLGRGGSGSLQVVPGNADMPSSQFYGSDMYRQGNLNVSHVGGGSGSSRPREKNPVSGGRGRRNQSGGGAGGGGGTSGRRGAEPKHPISSAKLEEFRAMKNRDWTMHQIAGYVVEFCQDQNGSRFIQQRLEMGDAAEQQVVAKEVLPAIRRLRNDVFGNYVVQKLLDFGSPQVKGEIRDTLEGEMLQLSLQMYGCRVVQKALEALAQDDVSRLLIEFHHNVLSCIHDQNGNHVIQKCIEVMSKRAKKERCVGANDKADRLNHQISFIIDDVLHNTVSLSCHPYGCRVLQRILEHCDEDRKERVLNEIKKCHRKLLDDQYGNYVIQHVLQYGRVTDRDAILAIVVESGLLGLSRQKFASNVVEKLLKYGNDRHICTIVREMLKQGGDPSTSSGRNPASSVGGSVTPGNSVVLHMVRDAYANYVVQTTLDVVPEQSEERTLLIHELNEHSDELRQYTFAKHIVAKLVSLNGGSL